MQFDGPTVLTNARIASMAPGAGVVAGSVALDAGRIVALGADVPADWPRIDLEIGRAHV